MKNFITLLCLVFTANVFAINCLKNPLKAPPRKGMVVFQSKEFKSNWVYASSKKQTINKLKRQCINAGYRARNCKVTKTEIFENNSGDFDPLEYKIGGEVRITVKGEKFRSKRKSDYKKEYCESLNNCQEALFENPYKLEKDFKNLEKVEQLIRKLRC